MSAVKPKRRAAKIAALNPRRTARVGATGLKLAARNRRTTARGARLLGRSARGGTKLWAKGKATKATGRGGVKAAGKLLKGRAAARTGAKVLKAARRRRPSRARLIATSALAAVGAYFLDPQNGKRRRGFATDKVGKALRRGKHETEHKVSHAQDVAAGAASQASSGGDREPAEARLNDPALARKVESEIFRDAESAVRGAVSVNVENGVVHLRGQLDDPAKISALAADARKVAGVREVENLLHTPESPASAKSDGGPGSGAP